LALLVSYAAAVLPQDAAPKLGSLSDKSTHFIAFAVLTLLFRFSYRLTWFRTLLILCIYAGFIEVSQFFTPDRCAEVLDIVADIIGIGIGFLFYPYIKRLLMGYIEHANR